MTHVPEEHRANTASLSPPLRGILETELAAGNRIAESWQGWGHVVLLERPFLRRHVVEGAVVYRDVSDPRHWKAEYFDEDNEQAVACRA
ncbi:MAG: hypothetical protein AAF533_15255 [Acidobacteriota bacterium]